MVKLYHIVWVWFFETQCVVISACVIVVIDVFCRSLHATFYTKLFRTIRYTIYSAISTCANGARVHGGLNVRTLFNYLL